MNAAVKTELHIYADGFHGFDGFAAESEAAQRFMGEQIKLLNKALHG